ncbi:hypothetical protein IJT10_05560 [bacterium]|nr:hypothetical protein [bacterium]
MKRFVLVLVITVISVANIFIVPALAVESNNDGQPSSQPKKQSESGNRPHRDMAKYLKNELNLTEFQYKKAEPMFKDFEAKLKKLDQDAKDSSEKTLTKEQKDASKQAKKAGEDKEEAAFRELKEQLQSILTPDQKWKLSSINFKDKRGKRERVAPYPGKSSVHVGSHPNTVKGYTGSHPNAKKNSAGFQSGTNRVVRTGSSPNANGSRVMPKPNANSRVVPNSINNSSR